MAKPASKKSTAVIPARRLPASVTPGQKTVVVAEDTTVQHRFCFDREQRTCLVVSQDAEVTKFIPLETESGLCICTTSTIQFTERFRTVPNHSLSKGAAVYARYAREVGATPEVMAFLGHFTSLTPQEVAMATNRKKTNDETTATKKVAAKEKVAAKSPKIEKSIKGLKPTEAPAKKTESPKPSGEKKLTASKMFQDLIMEGKLTDAKIFEKVQAKFGLDDSKFSYVKWYRNDLKKRGMNPPEAK